jgi:formylglycine-generating enzyme required for sulfatase activity
MRRWLATLAVPGLLFPALFLAVDGAGGKESTPKPAAAPAAPKPAAAPATPKPAAAPAPKAPARDPANPAGITWIRVPGGEFAMGSESGDADEKPVHTVRLAGFEMSASEVTVAQFRAFAEATGHQTDAERDNWAMGLDSNGTWRRLWGFSWKHPGFHQEDDYPVTCVTWKDAAAFAAWAKARLPTEAEWEYAAGGGAARTRYSWGDDLPPGVKGVNLADAAGKKQFAGWSAVEGYDDGFVFTAPARGFVPNALGLSHMSGNVWEWCADFKDAAYYATSPAENPRGPEEGHTRVLRGGSWNSGGTECRVANRAHQEPQRRTNNVGFRVARDLPAPPPPPP